MFHAYICAGMEMSFSSTEKAFSVLERMTEHTRTRLYSVHL